jgi:outer membrane autotransporter protein
MCYPCKTLLIAASVVIGALGSILSASAQPFTVNYGPLSATVDGGSAAVNLTVATSITGDATLNVTDIVGDLSHSTEFLDVLIDGVNVGTVTGTNDCGASPDVVIVVPNATIAPLIADGAITLTFDASIGVNAFCGVGSDTAFTVSGSLVYDSAAGTDESQTLADQQRSTSALVTSFQSSTLADGVFDHLNDTFNGGGSGPVVTASGFSASATDVAAWLGRNRQRALETRLADMPRSEDGSTLLVSPAASVPPLEKPTWNAWIKGKWTYYDGDGSSFDGHMIDLLAGIDYRVDDTVAMGVLGGYGNTKFDIVTGGTPGEFSADGYTAGPYLGLKLSDEVQLNVLAAYTYSDYDNRAGATTGDFSAHRVTLGAQLKGAWEMGDFFIEPGIRALYAEERQDAHTDSAGTRQSSLTVKAGRVSVGPKIGYVHQTDDGMTVKTWVALYGEYDFSNQGSAPTSSLPDLDDIISGRVSAGLDIAIPGGTGLSLQGDLSGLGGGEYVAYGGTARLNLPF